MTFDTITVPAKTRELRCGDYGFECDFQTKGEMEQVVIDFMRHCLDAHGIEYGSEVIANFLRRKYPTSK